MGPPFRVGVLREHISSRFANREIISKGCARQACPSERAVAACLLGASLLPGTAAAFTKLAADETEKWGEVVKFAGAKVT